jgi:thiamine biosynthesis lipoprotein
VADFGRLCDGAFATSRFGAGARSGLSTTHLWAHSHVSVAAPTCLLADALTKVVAATADAGHPLLARSGARGWLH